MSSESLQAERYERCHMSANLSRSHLESAKVRRVNGSLEASCADGHHAAEARGMLE